MKRTRNTIQRMMILDIIRNIHIHPTADEIYRLVAAVYPRISKGTVYRNLNLLAEQGELLRLELPNVPDRFDAHTAPHYHFRCRHCGRLFDVDMPYIPHLESLPNEMPGFQFEGHELIFTGVCPACSQIQKDEKNKEDVT